MHFGAACELTAAAPGRVNLLGGHIDYHGGTVFPLAIDRYTVVCGRRTDSGLAKFVSFEGEPGDTTRRVLSEFEIDLGKPLTPKFAASLVGEGADHLCGVLAGFERDKNDLLLRGLEICICSNVPIGGGLSSSAALQVAFATCLQEWTGCQKTPIQLALLCQNAERQFAGVPCGAMDQLTAVFGRAGQLLQIDCRDSSVRHHRWPDELTVLLIDSGVRHRLADGGYAVSRNASEVALAKLSDDSFHEITLKQIRESKMALKENERAAAIHVVSELQRGRHFESAFAAGDWVAAGQQLFASHESLRDNYRVSCSQLDTIVDAAKSIGSAGGCFGARMTGGGFGGYVVALVAKDCAASIQDRLHQIARCMPLYTAGSLPSLRTNPAQGAHVA